MGIVEEQEILLISCSSFDTAFPQFTCRTRLEPKPHRLEAMGLTRPEARAARLIAEDLAGSEAAREHFNHHPPLMEQIRVHDQVTEAVHAHDLPLA